MELCLYINTKLTSSPALNPSSLRPIYPSNNPLDSHKKSEIFLLSLKSLSNLNIKKIIFNVDYDSNYINDSELIEYSLKKLFPNAEIAKEKNRPTNLQAWKHSSQFAKEFFGLENPVICIFNHDHIFIDHIPEIFQILIHWVQLQILQQH